MILKGLVFHGGPSLAESEEEEEEEREIGQAYRIEIRTAGCRQSGWLGSGSSNPVDPRRCRGTVYPTTFVVYQAKKRGPRLSSEKSDVRYIGAMPGRLGFFGRNSAKLRKGGFLSCTRSMICTRVLLSSYLHFFFSFFYPIPFSLFLIFHPLFPYRVSFRSNRIIVTFCDSSLWNMLQNHDAICPIATRLIADPRHSPFTSDRSLPYKHS